MLPVAALFGFLRDPDVHDRVTEFTVQGRTEVDLRRDDFIGDLLGIEHLVANQHPWSGSDVPAPRDEGRPVLGSHGVDSKP